MGGFFYFNIYSRQTIAWYFIYFNPDQWDGFITYGMVKKLNGTAGDRGFAKITFPKIAVTGSIRDPIKCFEHSKALPRAIDITPFQGFHNLKSLSGKGKKLPGRVKLPYRRPNTGYRS